MVSIVTAVGNGWIRDELSGLLTPSQISQIFRSTASIDQLPESVQTVVRSVFVNGFNLQMHIVLGFAVASFLSIALMWRRIQIRVD